MEQFFSVIIPTYNRGYILWKTIQNVQKQMYPHWELLIVDDGSTDNTMQIVAQFINDPRIKYFRREHIGAQNVRNFGLENAKGSIITYVDSDDLIYENYLSAALELFKNYPKTVFATANYNYKVEVYNRMFTLEKRLVSKVAISKVVTVKDYFHRLTKTCGTGIFHTAKVVKDGIRWDTNLKRFQDWDFLIQLGSAYPEGFVYIPLVLFEYAERYGILGISSDATYADWADGFEQIYQKHKEHSLMQGQKWYPHRVNKYLQLHKIQGGKSISHQIRHVQTLDKES